MRTAHAAILAGSMVTLFALTGCTAAGTSESGGPEQAESPSPSIAPIDPGPVELSVEEAGERYLNLVCPVNQGIEALNAAFTAGEEEFLNGGAPDPAPAKAAAAGRIETTRIGLEHLDDEYFTWPDGVADQIAHIRSSYISELATLNAISNAASFEDAYYASWAAATPEQQGAGQEIRYQLGLEVDTVASCAGREDGLSVLSAEREEREALLAAQREG